MPAVKVWDETTGQWITVAGNQQLADVATSGSYNDLADKPTLGTAAAKNITISTEDPSGGSHGDIWIKYTP